MADIAIAADARRQARMMIDGHEITMSFAEHYNPTLAQLVKNTLIDSFLRINEIGGDVTAEKE